MTVEWGGRDQRATYIVLESDGPLHYGSSERPEAGSLARTPSQSFSSPPSRVGSDVYEYTDSGLVAELSERCLFGGRVLPLPITVPATMEPFRDAGGGALATKDRGRGESRAGAGFDDDEKR